MTGWALTARPLLYEPKGGSAFIVQGTLSRPSDGELVGGLDEQQSVFVAPWAPFAAAGATSPDKFDNVTDPGPAPLVDVVGEESAADEIKLCGTDATGSVSFAVGAKWTAYNVTATAWQSGTVLAINPGAAGTVQLSSPVAGLLNQQILIYPAESRILSAHNVEVIYNGSGPEFVRCEVTG